MPEFTDTRFWSKVQRSESCWLWTGAFFPHKYCRLIRDGKLLLAHRYCYEQTHGVTLSKAQFVMHSCDNPSCVNPAHLSIGTQTDNMRDCASRDRISHGEGCGKNKLTQQDVHDIRANYALCRVTMKELAARFGVGLTTVHQAIHGTTWKRSLPRPLASQP